MYNSYEVKPKMSAFVKSYSRQIKWICLLIEDDLLEKYNTIWDNPSADIKKQFDSKPLYNEFFLKVK